MPNIPDIQFTEITSIDVRDSDYLRLFRQLEPVKVQGFKLRAEELLKLTGQAEPEKVFRYPFVGKYIKWPHIFISEIVLNVADDYPNYYNALCILGDPTDDELQDFLNTQGDFIDLWGKLGGAEICGSFQNAGVDLSNYIQQSVGTAKTKIEEIQLALFDANDEMLTEFNFFEAKVESAINFIAADNGDVSVLQEQLVNCENITVERNQIFLQRQQRLDSMYNFYNSVQNRIEIYQDLFGC